MSKQEWHDILQTVRYLEASKATAPQRNQSLKYIVEGAENIWTLL